MDIKRSATILLPDDPDLRATVAAFQRVQQELSEPCYNNGAAAQCAGVASCDVRLVWQVR